MITLSECVSVDKRKFDVLLGKSKVACKGCGRGAMKINNHSRAVFGNIAILKMDKPFKFAEQSRPICMPKLEDVYLTEKVSSVRWRTEKMGLTRRSQILEERNIGIFSNVFSKNRFPIEKANFSSLLQVLQDPSKAAY